MNVQSWKGATAKPDRPRSEPAPRKAGPRTNGTRPSPYDRACAYVATMQGGIEGSGGSRDTMRAAIAAARGFALSEDDTFAVLREHHNPKCEPPWSDKELAHKAKSAFTSDRTPLGYLLDADRDGSNHAHRGHGVPDDWRETPPDPGWDPSETDAPPDPNPEPNAPPEPVRDTSVKLPFLWVRDFGKLSEPPPLRWLLHDTRTGKPFLRAGKCVVVGGDGGVGKGFLWLMLAVSIATGKDLFGAFRPAQSGRVAILAAEDDQQEIHHRLYRIANALGLGTAEVTMLRDRVGIFPLSGEQVNLLSVDAAHNAQRTPLFEGLVKQLRDLAKDGDFEWSFIGLDPLARFGAANVENDQAAATAFTQALESMAARLPGVPAIGVTHHSSAASVSQGRSNIRGVTGLRNAFRAALILDAVEAKDGLHGVLLRNDKNNLAPSAPPLWLVRLGNEPLGNGQWLETAGVLREATAAQIEMLEAVAGAMAGASKEQRVEANQGRKKDAFEADCVKVLSALPMAPTHVSSAVIDTRLRAAGIAFGDKKLKSLLEHLASADGGGRVVDLSDGTQSSARQWAQKGGQP